ncbi:hypothetical protein HU200_042157 [Digitaria exilis]|uniref:LOB domain-containing protein n=1 Tax=Digitaria exilis TaxID=1010633 RepID=A0A835EG46_9POAL|nr:hypothetical protein HU200_042157 [Digitaria exilis]
MSSTSTTTTTTTTNGSSAASLGSASSSLSSPRPTTTSSGSGSGVGTGQACAACKYQRRKCTRECPLAPYFPADEPQRFLNAHRLFGVKNIQHTLRKIDPEHWSDAMRTLIYQADARAADPVGGCVAIIDKLQREMRRAELELAYVKQQIAIYQQVAAAAADDPPAVADPAAAGTSAAAAMAGHHLVENAAAMDALYDGQGGEPLSEGDGLVFHDEQGLGFHVVKAGDDHPQPPQQQQFFNYFGYDAATSSHEQDDGTVGQQYGFGDTTSVRIGSSVALGDQLQQHCQIEAAPFVDAFGVKPHGPAGVARRQEKLGAVLKHGADQQMEEAATGGPAPCHLELGFSSF